MAPQVYCPKAKKDKHLKKAVFKGAVARLANISATENRKKEGLDIRQS